MFGVKLEDSQLPDILIGRGSEVNRLKTIADESAPQIVIVYGRRRVGKTTLIEHSLTHKKVLKIEGIEGASSSRQIKHAVETLFEYVKDINIIEKKITSWKKFFTLAANYLGTHFDVLYLEELQWLANYRAELVSELKYVWDNIINKKSNFTLVLCGSSPSFIVNKVVHSNALYNRSQHEIHLKPFSLEETWQFLGKTVPFERIFEAYLLVGGIPEYLKRIKQESSYVLGVANNSFLPDRFFLNEYKRIFISSLVKNPLYKKILEYLSKKGRATRSEIEAALKTTSGGGLTDILQDLELSSFISTEDTILSSATSNKKRFYISDQYVLFYNRFIKANLKKIEKGDFVNSPLTLLSRSQLNAFMGYNFERFCLKHTKLIADILGFGAVNYRAGTFYKLIANKPLQLDLIFERDDKVLTICEIKYSDKNLDTSTLKHFQEKIETLIKLIKEKKYTKYKIHTVLITACKLDNKVKREIQEGLYFDKVVELSAFEKAY